MSDPAPPEVKIVDYPTGFLADLRSSRTWPSLEGSLWRAPYLARSTFGHAWKLIHGLLPSSAATVLEVGSGTGYLSLELARAGHRVVALDTDEDALAVATATLDNDRGAREAVTGWAMTRSTAARPRPGDPRRRSNGRCPGPRPADEP